MVNLRQIEIVSPGIEGKLIKAHLIELLLSLSSGQFPLHDIISSPITLDPSSECHLIVP